MDFIPSYARARRLPEVEVEYLRDVLRKVLAALTTEEGKQAHVVSIPDDERDLVRYVDASGGEFTIERMFSDEFWDHVNMVANA